MQLLIVINPVSGSGKQNWEALISAWFKDREPVIQFYTIQRGQDNIKALQQVMKDFAPDRVIVAGGDGTVKTVAESIIDTTIPMAIIPAGSANGMAKELCIPAGLEDALELALNGNPHPVDLVNVNGEWCIHLSDIGLNAQLLRYFEATSGRGMWGYTKAFFKIIGRRTYMKVTIQTNEKQVERKAYMVVMANATCYGTGAVINPEGKVNDGYFEVVIVRKIAMTELLKMVFVKRPFDPDKVEILCCTSMELSATKPYPFQVDGEYRGKVNHIKASIKKAAVQVIKPA